MSRSAAPAAGVVADKADASSACFVGLHIALVGPLPPPAGGMANQTVQLAHLLRAGGAEVELVQTNRPVQPDSLAALRGLRALLRLIPYLWRLWHAADRVQLLHVMANSGWSWHLHAAPAICIARLRGKGVLVNYRGGAAAEFLHRSPILVRGGVHCAHALLVPSAYLVDIFARYAIHAQIVPNIVDTTQFTPADNRVRAAAIVIARQLEPLYDHATALHAFAIVHRQMPHARLTVCGSGPTLPDLRRLTQELAIVDAVDFVGQLGRDAMAKLYRQADLALNASRIDNSPNSVLEAWASGVPVVSTNVGGIPELIRDGDNGLLCPPANAAAMAQAILAVLTTPTLARKLALAGLAQARRYQWGCIAPLWAAQYRRVLQRPTTRGYTALVSGLLFPLHEKLKRHHSVVLRRELECTQWWSAQQLQALQVRRLRALLLHVSEYVPYYRQLYARIAFDASRVEDVDALQRLPILTKDEMNRHRDAFIADNAGPLKRANTGGSSGEPLIFFQGKHRLSHDVAAKWRATRWWGVDIGDREALMWGSPIELNAQDRWRQRRDWLLRSFLLPAFELSSTKLDAYLHQLKQLQPAMLFGYPSALCRLVEHARQRHVPLNQLGVKVVFVTAERLYDEQRVTLQQAFAAPVANGYGGRDAGFIAHECPEGGLHISAEDVIVEIVDAHGLPVAPGELGAIVITHLASADFPFIRYATGDVGALDPRPCRCGRGLPLLKQVEGRVSDFVVAQDGTVMHGLALIYVLRELSQVRAFKIIQETLALTRVQVVSDSALPQPLRLSIINQFRARLGASVVIQLEEVARIAPEASGKHRYVISKVVAT